MSVYQPSKIALSLAEEDIMPFCNRREAEVARVQLRNMEAENTSDFYYALEIMQLRKRLKKHDKRTKENTAHQLLQGDF
jgi:hypothetical protein